jgi:hypothetical protein
MEISKTAINEILQLTKIMHAVKIFCLLHFYQEVAPTELNTNSFLLVFWFVYSWFAFCIQLQRSGIFVEYLFG